MPDTRETQILALADHRLWLRFWSKVEFGDCWQWQAGCSHDGYGRFTVAHGHMQYTHRLSYEYLVGAIPEGLQLDHLCRNRKCVRPDHLEPVTQLENIQRGEGRAAIRGRQTHCELGHPLAGDNLAARSDGKRRCRICRNIYVREWREKRRAAA